MKGGSGNNEKNRMDMNVAILTRSVVTFVNKAKSRVNTLQTHLADLWALFSIAEVIILYLMPKNSQKVTISLSLDFLMYIAL